jgi:hypothetical protein
VQCLGRQVYRLSTANRVYLLVRYSATPSSRLPLVSALLGLPLHLPFDQLEPVHMPFDRAVAPGQSQCRFYTPENDSNGILTEVIGLTCSGQTGRIHDVWGLAEEL